MSTIKPLLLSSTFVLSLLCGFGETVTGQNKSAVVQGALVQEGTLRIPLDEPYSQYTRLLQLSGLGSSHTSFFLRPVEVRVDGDAEHPWADQIGYEPLWEFEKLGLSANLLDPAYYSSVNSDLPTGGNDGALWQGKGLNQSLTVGVSASFGPIHIQLKPVLVRSENLEFPLYSGNRSVYEYPYVGFVQRFGSESFSEVNLGDSFAAVRLLGLEASVGNERIWIGPSTTYPMLFGSNAPGFLHGRVGTYKPLNIWLGHVEGHYLFGKLESSEYSSIHTRSLNTVMASFSPRWIPGLSLGAQRVFVDFYPESLRDLIFYENIFQVFLKYKLADEETGDDGSQPDNQIVTLFGRWAFPEYQFEMYGTFGVNDHRTDARDTRAHPDHASGWNFGVMKLFERSSKEWVSVNFEVTELEDTRTSIARGWPNPNRWSSVPFTNHSSNPFNHRGTPIGSMVGPGGNAVTVKINAYNSNGLLGLRLNRHSYMNSLLHNSTLFNGFSTFQNLDPANAGTAAQDLRQVEYQIAGEMTRFLPWYGMELDLGLEYTYRMNHNFVYQNDIGNWRFSMSLRKRFGGQRW